MIQHDGRIVLTSRVDDNFAVTRLSSLGEPDGTVYEPADFGGIDEPRAATLQGDGKLVVAGSSGELMLAAERPGAVARYTADGKLDKTFDEDGKAAYGPAAPNAVMVQAGGGIVVAGESVARLTGAGAPDPSFGAAAGFGVAGAALQPDDRILVAGTLGEDIVAARLQPAGGIDPTFGALGATTIRFGDENLAYSAAAQGDGRFVVAGRAAVGGSARLVVARLLADPLAPAAQGADTTPPRLTRLHVVKRRLAVRFRLSSPPVCGCASCAASASASSPSAAGRARTACGSAGRPPAATGSWRPRATSPATPAAPATRPSASPITPPRGVTRDAGPRPDPERRRGHRLRPRGPLVYFAGSFGDFQPHEQEIA